ncbi:DUF6498-containing protein [Halapricum desulfuricans]|uniref:DUF6498-containing protein n=1 Tax=Halapricum desulfuricans TaxID=2841257 RepID=UPI001E364A07|nr:DUF6498-containing protein [Halapricum desulfuricans]
MSSALHDAASPTALPAVVGNLVPIAGVLALDWSPAAVLLVYQAELAAIFLWTILKVPFAYKRPNNMIERPNSIIGDDSAVFRPIQQKRGSISIPGPLPPLYPRNVPTLIVALVLTPFALAIAFVAFSLTRPEITEAAAGAFIVGGIVVFVARGIETWREYFRGAGYREHSPRSVLLTPFKYFLIVGIVFLAFFVLESVIEVNAIIGAERAVLLLAVGKLGYDIRSWRVQRDDERRSLFERLYGSAATEIEPTPVEIPGGEPVRRVSMNRGMALIDALVHGLLFWFRVPAIFAWLVVGYGILTSNATIALVGLGIGVAVSVPRIVARYVRYGTVEYRCYDDAIVVYDTLLEEPQARMDDHAVTDATASTGWLDRLFGTKTLSFEVMDHGDGPDGRLFVPEDVDTEDDADESEPLVLPHVEDPRRVTDALGLSWHLDGEA